MAKNKAQQRETVTKAVAEITKNLIAEIDAAPEVVDNGKMLKLNSKGGMLMCHLQFPKQPGKPDPQVVTVNDEIKWVKRGAKVIVPWYFIEHLLHNVERKFRQETVDGKKVVLWDDMQSEAFSYREIDPADGVECEGPRTQAVTTL